ncbi:MAG: STAS domain-containing protein [Phycisphaerales bacterium]|nr:STAS domain-containing protein [Phycisphaerales bacterium]
MVMPIHEWSDNIFIAELNDEPAFSEDMDSLHRRLGERERDMPDVIVNMKAISYINSSNIAQLLRLRKHLLGANGRLRLCAIDKAVWSVMIVAGLDKLFECTDDVSTALASLQLT